jgi:DNA-binding NarL/FixJ family response regulator
MAIPVIDARQPPHRQPPSPAIQPVRVVIADQDGLARSMIRTALHDAKGIAPVASTGDGREALELVRHYRPAILILDTALLSECGIELIGQLLLASPQTRVLTIAVNDHHTALAALRAGAAGHLSKEIDPHQLARLVQRAAQGEGIIPPKMITPLLKLLREAPTTGWRPVHSRLTTREWEMVELLRQGAGTQDIAEQLVISPTTVYSHIKKVLHKLGVHSRSDAVAAAHHLRQTETLGEKLPTPVRPDSPRPADTNRHTTTSGTNRPRPGPDPKARPPQQQALTTS